MLAGITIAAAVLWAAPMGLYLAICERSPIAPCSYSPWPGIYEFTGRHQLALLAVFVLYSASVLLLFSDELGATIRKISGSRVIPAVILSTAALAIYAYYQMHWVNR